MNDLSRFCAGPHIWKLHCSLILKDLGFAMKAGFSGLMAVNSCF